MKTPEQLILAVDMNDGIVFEIRLPQSHWL